MTTAISIKPPKDGVVDTCMAFLLSMAGRHFNADLRLRSDQATAKDVHLTTKRAQEDQLTTHRESVDIPWLHGKWQTPGDKLVAVGSSVRNIY